MPNSSLNISFSSSNTSSNGSSSISSNYSSYFVSNVTRDSFTNVISPQDINTNKIDLNKNKSEMIGPLGSSIINSNVVSG